MSTRHQLRQFVGSVAMWTIAACFLLTLAWSWFNGRSTGEIELTAAAFAVILAVSVAVGLGTALVQRATLGAERSSGFGAVSGLARSGADPAGDEPARIGDGILERGRKKPVNVAKSARWLVYLALMFVVFGTLHGISTHRDSAELLEQLELVPGDEVETVDGVKHSVSDLRAEIERNVEIVFGVNYLLSAIMFGLFFWARRNPYHAMITGLLVYLAVVALNAIMDPDTLLQGLVIKAIIVVVLVNGIRAARAERAEAARLAPAKLV